MIAHTAPSQWSSTRSARRRSTAGSGVSVATISSSRISELVSRSAVRRSVTSVNESATPCGRVSPGPRSGCELSESHTMRPSGVADPADDVMVGAAGPKRVDGRKLIGRSRCPVLPHGRPAAVKERAADDSVVVETEDALGAGVARGDPSLGVDQDDSLGHRRDDRLVASLAGVQSVVGGRVGDDDPESVGGGAVRGRERVVVDAKRPAAGGGEHADDRRARLHHAAAQAGRVRREAGEHLGDRRAQELPARTAGEGGERRVRARVTRSSRSTTAQPTGTLSRSTRGARRAPLPPACGASTVSRGSSWARAGECTGRDASLLAANRQARGCALKYALRT